MIDNLFDANRFRFTFEPVESMMLGNDTVYLIDSLASPVAMVNIHEDSEYVFNGHRPNFSHMYVMAVGHETTAVSVKTDSSNQHHDEPTITVKPNPVKSVFQLDVKCPVEIYNELGRLVGKVEGGRFNTLNLPNGVYLLRSENGSGRFVKE